MIPSALISVLALQNAAMPSYELNLDAVSEVRVRHPGETYQDGAFVDAWDLSLDGQAELGMDFKRLQLSLSYGPNLTITNFGMAPQTDLLHQAAIVTEVAFKRSRLKVIQTGAYGTRSFTSLSGGSSAASTGQGNAPTTTPDGTGTDGAPTDGAGAGTDQPATGAGQPGDQVGVAPTGTQQPPVLPGATSVLYAAVATQALYEQFLTRRSRLALALGYSAAGGVDDESRQTTPFSFGPTVGADYRYLLTRVDTLSSIGTYQWASTSAGNGQPEQPTEVVSLSQAWRHVWTEETTTDVSVGLSIVPGALADEERSVSPAGSVGFTYLEPFGVALDPYHSSLELDLTAGLTTSIDRLTGLADERVVTNGRASWSRRDIEIYGLFGHARSIGDNPNAIIVTNGESGIRYKVVEPVGVDVGWRVQYQSIANPTTVAAQAASTGLQWVAFLRVRVAADPISF